MFKQLFDAAVAFAASLIRLVNKAPPSCSNLVVTAVAAAAWRPWWQLGGVGGNSFNNMAAAAVAMAAATAAAEWRRQWQLLDIYSLSTYEGIWNSHVGSLPLGISGTWHSIVRLVAKASLPPPCLDTCVSCYTLEHK